MRIVRTLATFEEWEEFVSSCADDENWLDALFCADEENNREVLEEEAQLLHERLIEEERDYMAQRFGKVSFH